MTDDQIIERMMSGMASRDVYVRGDAKVNGMKLIESGNASEAFRESFWLALVQDLRFPLEVGYDPVRFMVKIDQAATLKMIQHPAMLDYRHPLLEPILSTLIAYRVSLPPSQVENLEMRVPPKKRDTYKGRLLKLAALAKCRGIGERIDRVIEDELRAPRNEFQDWWFGDACRARELYHGLANLTIDVADDDHDLGGVKADLKLASNLSCIDLLYVLGDNWFDGKDPRAVVLPLLARLGLPKHAELFDAAATRFQGSDSTWPAPEIAKERGSSYRDGEPEEESEFFSDLQEEWYGLNRELTIATEAYAWEHRRPLNALTDCSHTPGEPQKA